MPYQILFVARAPQHLFNFQFIFPVCETADDSRAVWRAACDIQPGAVRLGPSPDDASVVLSWSGGNIAPGATAHRLLGGGEVALVLQPLFSLRFVGPIPAAAPFIAAIPAGRESDLDRAA